MRKRRTSPSSLTVNGVFTHQPLKHPKFGQDKIYSRSIALSK